MAVKIGINGFGRIGRNYLRAALAQGADLDIVAVNDLTDNKSLAHLLKYDSVGGVLAEDVSYDDDSITVGGKQIRVFEERDPANLPWGELGVDIVIESTGRFTKAEDAKKHIAGGAKKVLISAPATGDDVTIVMGVNEEDVQPRDRRHHLERLLHHELPRAAREGLQRRLRHRARLHDDRARLHGRPEPAGRPAQRPASRPRRRDQHRPRLDRCGQGHRPRAARAQRQAERLVVPRAGSHRLDRRPHDRHADRGPDRRPGQRRLQGRCRRGRLAGYLEYTEDPIVSSDIQLNPHSSIFDSELTNVSGNLVKVSAWYDNEWGYSNRLVDLTEYVAERL